MADNEGNLNTLKDMILDEERLVTYVSLSKELCIHVNESKILLHQAVQDIRHKKSNIDLNVNYIISGITDNNTARTSVCSENELCDQRKDLKTLFFEHIYSVSKGYPRVDKVSLLATHKVEDLILCSGIIKSSMCVKRTAGEIGTLKSNSQEFVTLDDNRIINKPQKKIKKESKENEAECNKIDAKCNDSKVVKKINESDINKIDAKQVENKPVKMEVCSPKKDVNSKPSKINPVKQRGIAAFLNKANDVISIKDKKKNVENPAKVVVVDEKLVEENATTQEIKVTDKDVKEEKQHIKKDDKNGDSKTQKIKKSNLKVDKKRKRVLHVSDSESDNETGDPFVTEEQLDSKIESEDEIPPTPSINAIKITSGIVNPRKRRKIVDKTYTDEDGYILTKKEEVYESCSENEEAEELKSKEIVQSLNKETTKISPTEKKNGIKNSKKKISPPQTGKQSTLMSYFKKVNE